MCAYIQQHTCRYFGTPEEVEWKAGISIGEQIHEEHPEAISRQIAVGIGVIDTMKKEYATLSTGAHILNTCAYVLRAYLFIPIF